MRHVPHLALDVEVSAIDPLSEVIVEAAEVATTLAVHPSEVRERVRPLGALCVGQLVVPLLDAATPVVELELVLEARDAVIKSFEEPSLIEGIAAELERKHGFTHIESSLRAAVRVSGEEGETAIAAVDERQAVHAEEDDFRSMLVEVESEDRPYRDN